MLDFLGWAVRIGAAVAAILAGVTLYAAAPEADDAGSEAGRARALCQIDQTERMLRALQANPEAALRRQSEIMAGCAPAPRRQWDDSTRDRGLAVGAGAFVLLILGAVLGSMAKREKLAEEMLAEARKGRQSEGIGAPDRFIRPPAGQIELPAGLKQSLIQTHGFALGTSMLEEMQVYAARGEQITEDMAKTRAEAWMRARRH